MSHPAFLTDNAHVLLSGVTGSGEQAGGKTATANWWASHLVEKGHFDFFVAVDPKGHQFEGAHATGAQEAAELVRNGHRAIDWQPARNADPEAEHNRIMSFARGLSGSVVVVHDDAVMYANADSLQNALAMDGNPGPGGDAIKSLVVTQDPWDLPRKGVRSNINNVGWVGPMTDSGERFWQVMNREEVAQQVREKHTQPYMWSVHDGSELHTFTPVPEEYAN